MECIEGEYWVKVKLKHKDYLQATKWLHESFGTDWGQSFKVIEYRDIATYSFLFKRLYHAQWFVMRWCEI